MNDRRMVRNPIALAVLLGITLIATPAAAQFAQSEDVATFQGDSARTGVQPGPVPNGELVEEWKFQAAGAVRSSPVLADGNVYFGSNDGQVYAVSASDGSLIWSFPTEAPVTAPATIADNAVFIGSNDGFVYALDQETGDLRWRFFAGALDVDRSASGGSADEARMLARATITSNVAFADGLVFIPTNDFLLHAVDASTGVERWHTVLGNTETVNAPTVVDGVVYVSSEEGVRAIDAETGITTWNATWWYPKDQDEDEENVQVVVVGTDIEDDATVNEAEDERQGAIDAALEDGIVTVAEYFSTFYSTDGQEIKWEVYSSPVVFDGIVWAVGTAHDGGWDTTVDRLDADVRIGGVLLGLDPATGGIVRMSDFSTRDQIFTTPAMAGEIAIFGTERGFIYAFDVAAGGVELPTTEDAASAQTQTVPGSDELANFQFGIERWGVSSEAYVYSSAAVVGNQLIAANEQGTLYILNVENGVTDARFQFPAPVYSSPAVEGGLIFIGCDDGYLYAIGA